MGFFCRSNTMSLLLLWVMAGITTFRVHAQSTQGYISIDCGLGKNYTYTDEVTGIPYTSDEQYIDRGVDYNIYRRDLNSSLAVQLSNLRSFPDGTRNCYTLKPVVKSRMYLVRATFLYGNYDGLGSASPGKPLMFDLHIDVNHWVTVNMTRELGAPYSWEAIHVAKADSISVCLINIGTGTPFISALELRPLQDNMHLHANSTQSLVTVYRKNLGGNTTLR